jgi:hypothetical protein
MALARGCSGTGLACVPPDQWPLWQRLGFDWQILGLHDQVIAVFPVLAVAGVIACSAWYHRRDGGLGRFELAYGLAGIAVTVTNALVRVIWGQDAWIDHWAAMLAFGAVSIATGIVGAGVLVRRAAARRYR